MLKTLETLLYSSKTTKYGCEVEALSLTTVALLFIKT